MCRFLPIRQFFLLPGESLVDDLRAAQILHLFEGLFMTRDAYKVDIVDNCPKYTSGELSQAMTFVMDHMYTLCWSQTAPEIT